MAGSEELVSQMLNFADFLEPKFELLAKIRKSPLQFVEGVIAEDMELLQKQVEVNVIATIITWIGAQIIKDLDKKTENAGLFYKLASMKECTGLTVYLYSCCCGVTNAAYQLQLQLHNMFMDKIMRVKVDTKFRSIADSTLS